MNKKELFEKAYTGSYYTIIGVADENEQKEGYQKIFDEQKIGKIKKWYSFTGKEFNDYYEPVGTDRFRDGVHFLAFPLDGLNVNKLAILKLQLGDRWFDDVVDDLKNKEYK